MKLNAISGASLRSSFPAPKGDKASHVPTSEPGLPVPERAIQRAIIARLRAHGFLVVRVNSGGFTDRNGTFVRGYTVMGLDTMAGFPDLAAYKGKQYLLIEVKKPDGELTDSQERFHDFADGFGVRVHVLRSPEEVEDLVRQSP